MRMVSLTPKNVELFVNTSTNTVVAKIILVTEPDHEDHEVHAEDIRIDHPIVDLGRKP